MKEKRSSLRPDRSRREFCLRSVRGGLWAAGAMIFGRFGRPVDAAAAPAADLAAVKGDAMAAARRAVELLGGMSRFVGKG